MKKVLLASTALVLSAGVAAADVSVGGDGRMGVRSDILEYGNDDLNFTSRIRISFSASGETDAGLAFGGSVRADNSGGGAAGTAGSVFIEGSFGKITMGDTSGAAEAAVGDLSGVGLTGLEDFNEMTYLSNAAAADRPSARWDYVTGDLGLHVSSDNPGQAGDDVYSLAVTYGVGDISFGLGMEDNGTDTHVIAGVTAGLGDATLKVIWGDTDTIGDGDQYGASIDYVTGATTLTAFWKNDTADNDDYGLGVSYDLGGGAAIKAGFSDGDSRTDAAYDFGVSMSF